VPADMCSHPTLHQDLSQLLATRGWVAGARQGGDGAQGVVGVAQEGWGGGGRPAAGVGGRRGGGKRARHLLEARGVEHTEEVAADGGWVEAVVGC